MSWIQRLYETYENAVRTDAITANVNPLPELGFITGEMPLTVTLTLDGRFLDADRSNDKEILIPCTLESGVARQAPVKPHPLFDGVQYLGTPEQMKILKDWCDNPDIPKSVLAVYTYLQKNMLKSDLEKALAMKKIKWKEKDGVKFRVINTALNEPLELWRNKTVLESWKAHFGKHYLSTASEELCYVMGKQLPAIRKHPYAISNMLLISMSDENCRGIFSGSAKDALSISCEASLKAHAALKWLIKRQGGWLDKVTVFLAWDTGGNRLPDVTATDPADSFAEYVDEDEEKQADTWFQLGKTMADGSRGYESRFLNELSLKNRSELSSVAVMVLDSASGKGRAAIVYYQELDIQSYLENLMHWYVTCRWQILRKRDGKSTEKHRTPLPGEICDLIYGTRDSESDKKLKKQLIKRLIPCIIYRHPVPQDIVLTAFRKAVNPVAFKTYSGEWDEYGWKKALGITCCKRQYKGYQK